jgi:hypothetical protein
VRDVYRGLARPWRGGAKRRRPLTFLKRLVSNWG